MKNYKKGFTLIELLVVIAIIGILSAVVLTSLSSARTKAKTAAFKAEASSIQPLAVTVCDGGSASTNIVPSLPATFSALNKSSITGTNCTADGTFSMSVKAIDNTSGAGCFNNATTITESGVTFGSGC